MAKGSETKGLIDAPRGRAVPITALTEETLPGWLKGQGKRLATWVKQAGFTGAAGRLCLLPGDDGALDRVLAGVDWSEGPWALAHLPGALPAGRFRLDPSPKPDAATCSACRAGRSSP